MTPQGALDAGSLVGDINPDNLSPSFTDWVRGYLRNSMLLDATAGGLQLGNNRDDVNGQSIPGWTVWAPSGAATATVTEDAGWPGGRYVELRTSAVGTVDTNSIAMTSDRFRILPGTSIRSDFVRSSEAPAGVTYNVRKSILYYDTDGNYLSQSDYGASGNGPASVPISFSGTDAYMSPVTAWAARLEYVVWETVAHDPGTYWRVGGAFVTPGGDGFLGVPYDATVSGSVYVGADVVATGNILSGGYRVPAGVCAPHAFPEGFEVTASYSSGLAVLAKLTAGVAGTFLVPFRLAAPMYLANVRFYSADTSGARAAICRLYYSTDDNTGGWFWYFPGTAGTWSIGAATPATRTLTLTGGTVRLPAGNYWLAIQNAHATNTLAIGAAAAGTFNVGRCWYKADDPVLTTSINFDVTVWSGQSYCPGVMLSAATPNDHSTAFL